jgi:hypothetical protein
LGSRSSTRSTVSVRLPGKSPIGPNPSLHLLSFQASSNYRPFLNALGSSRSTAEP